MANSLNFQPILLIFLLFSVLTIYLFPLKEMHGDSKTVEITLGSSSPSSGKSYEPKVLTVPTGTTVMWINNDETLHTVTSGSPQSGDEGAKFDSSFITAGRTFQYTFNNAGNFDYYCTLHPFMKGTINVVYSPTSLTTETTNSSVSSTIQYVTHTSNKYHIQFQYPSDWDFKEKTSRFDEGTSIEAKHTSFVNPGAIFITYIDDLTKEFGVNTNDLQSGLTQAFKGLIDRDYSQEYRVIEPMSFTNISGYKAGTFLYTEKDKYKEDASPFAQQIWLVFVGNSGFYLTFWSPAAYFDNPDTSETRDHFIKSIKFLDINNSTQTNQPSRFE